MEWAIVITIIVMAGLAAVGFNENRREDKRRTLREQELAKKADLRAELEGQLGDWAKQRQSEGWSYIAAGRLMHAPNQPRCMMAMSETAPLLRFD